MTRLGGLPLEVVKFMRDAIDNYRLTDSGVIQQIPPTSQQSQFEEMQINSYSEQYLEDSVEHDESEIIDASVPWNQRNIEEQSDDLLTNHSPFGFELTQTVYQNHRNWTNQ